MNLKIIDPTLDPEWDSLLLRNHIHSFFFSSAWAKVLVATYQYQPAYFISLAGDRLSSLVALMDVRSPFTGRRGVSLPFTDRCDPHALNPALFKETVAQILDHGRKNGWRSVEWRGSAYFEGLQAPSEIYYFHDLELEAKEDDIFSRFGDSHRRNIRKAKREGVRISIDQSLESLEEFYRLNCLTRRRHGLPPQPLSFFKNVLKDILSKDLGIIVSALYQKKTVASSVFFHFGNRAIYKYGASDAVFQRVRPNNLVMWEAIRWYRDRGFRHFSLGRTARDNSGLLRFKRLWGGHEHTLEYYKYDFRKDAFLGVRRKSTAHDLAEKIFARTPVPILRWIGTQTYRHIG